MGFEEIVAIAVAETHVEFFELAVPTAEIPEKLEAVVGFRILFLHEIAEVCDEIAVHLLLVHEAELLVDDRLGSHAAYGFGFVEHVVVELLLHSVGRVGVDVDAKIFAS